MARHRHTRDWPSLRNQNLERTCYENHTEEKFDRRGAGGGWRRWLGRRQRSIRSIRKQTPNGLRRGKRFAAGTTNEVHPQLFAGGEKGRAERRDRKSTRLNSSHGHI